MGPVMNDVQWLFGSKNGNAASRFPFLPARQRRRRVRKAEGSAGTERARIVRLMRWQSSCNCNMHPLVTSASPDDHPAQSPPATSKEKKKQPIVVADREPIFVDFYYRQCDNIFTDRRVEWPLRPWSCLDSFPLVYHSRCIFDRHILCLFSVTLASQVKCCMLQSSFFRPVSQSFAALEDGASFLQGLVPVPSARASSVPCMLRGP
jgi:hypothetical protein